MAEKIRLKPLNDRIVVQRAEKEEKTVGGIVLPDAAKEKPVEGLVVAAGDGRFTEKGERLPLQIQVGQTVMFGKYAGTEVKLDGAEYVVLREDDVIGVMA